MAYFNTKKNLKNKIFSFIEIKKQIIKKLKKVILNLEIVNNTLYQSLYLLINKFIEKQKYNLIISYIIYLNFLPSNIIMQIIDASRGETVLFHTAGALNLKGKQKTSKKLVLTKFYQILSFVKLNFLQNKPIAIYCKNAKISSNFIRILLDKLQKIFFIKIVKTYNLKPYNGCRKKKKKRK